MQSSAARPDPQAPPHRRAPKSRAGGASCANAQRLRRPGLWSAGPNLGSRCSTRPAFPVPLSRRRSPGGRVRGLCGLTTWWTPPPQGAVSTSLIVFPPWVAKQLMKKPPSFAFVFWGGSPALFAERLCCQAGRGGRTRPAPHSQVRQLLEKWDQTLPEAAER